MIPSARCCKQLGQERAKTGWFDEARAKVQIPGRLDRTTSTTPTTDTVQASVRT